MIYMTSDDGKLTICVLETANLDELKKGRPIRSPDGKVFIAWTADVAWLAAQLQASDGAAGEIGRLIDQSAKRPGKPGPGPYHKPVMTRFAREDG